MLNIVTTLQEKATSIPDTLAFVFLEDGKNPSHEITYKTLDEKARNIAGFLQHKNLFGERVLLLYPAGIDFITAFFGCLYAGAIPVPVHCAPLSEIEPSLDLLKTIASDAAISAILTPEVYFEKIKNHFSENQLIIDIKKLDRHSYKKIKLKETDIAYLQYTSGSTSTPKAAIIQHQNLTHSLNATIKAWRYSKNSITLNWAPHSHVYGLVCGIVLPLYHGSLGVLMPTSAFIQRPLNWLEAIHRYRATHAGCPNFGYDLCVRDISEDDITELDLSSWKTAVNGGEAVQVDTLTQFSQKFESAGFSLSHFCPAYGMSELSGAISSHSFEENPAKVNLALEELQHDTVLLCDAEKPHREISTLGKLLDGIEAVIINPNTLTPSPENKIGEIWLSAPSLANGYWNRDTETKETFQAKIKDSSKNYFRTGDLGFILNNEIFITGRLKEIVIVRGKKYYPAEIEKQIRRELAKLSVNETGIIFNTSSRKKEEIIFLQEIKNTLTEEKEAELTRLIRKITRKTFGIDLDKIIFVKSNSIPKTASGKIQRKRCEQFYQKNKLELAEIENNLLNEFIQIVSSVLGVKAKTIHLDSPVSEYAFDSINIIKLSAKLNTHFSLDISPAVLFEHQTLKEFYDDLAKQISQKKKAIDNSIRGTDIAIIGIAGLFPGANDVDEFWQNLLQQKDVITTIPEDRWRTDSASTHRGGFIKDIAQFDAGFFTIAPREAELIDPQQRLFLQTAWKAVEDAGYTPADLAKTKTGVFVGVFKNDYAELLSENGINDSYLTTGITQSILANRVSYYFNLNGPSEIIDTACSSSLVAIHHAVRAIHSHDCELAIAGGVNAMITPTSFLSAETAGMLSPDGQCKTFDKSADGYVRGEGIGAILLKPLKKAIKDKDTIYGIIKGSAINHGGHVSSLTVPNPNAQAEVIIDACRQANVAIDEINYIETHGTGTSLGDPIEINGLKKAFNTLTHEQQRVLNKNSCALGALKTHIGHLESAAGIASVIKVVLSMKNGILPANRHFSELNPYIELADSPFFLANQTMAWKKIHNKPRTAGISSFGFGGTNAHLILQEYERPRDAAISRNEISHFIPLSAKTDSALQTKIKEFYSWLTLAAHDSELPKIEDIAYTLTIGRVNFNKRCAFKVTSTQHLRDTLEKIVHGEVPDNFIDDTEENKNLFQQNLSAYPAGSYSRISLPTYPFEPTRFWITKTKERKNTLTEQKVTSPEEFFDVEKSLLFHIKAVLKISDHIDQSAALSDLGFDSISYKELASRLENQYKIEFTPTVFFTYTSVSALINYITQSGVTSLVKTESDKLASYSNEPIAIIGIQAYLPQSPDLETFWKHLEEKHDLVSEIPRERWNFQDYAEKSNSKWCASLENYDQFDAAFFTISSREANLMDPQQRLFMEIVWKTIEDAGYDPLTLSTQKTGVFVGVEFSEYPQLLSKHTITHGYSATGNSHALLANRVSYFLNLTGPSEAIDTACSSSLVAIHRAVNALRHNECKVAIAGGVSLMLNPDTVTITSQLGVLSKDGRCKTFDKSANGYVKGEGVAALLLKPLKQAEEDGDAIYGIIRGSGVNHGGKAQSLTAPNPRQQAELLIDVYRKAGINPETITYIEAHGTGTELGDPIEVDALKSAFQQLTSQNKKNYCGLGSVKTNIGHLEPASGIVGVIKVLLAMKYQKLPGILHFQELNPFIRLDDSPFYIVKDTQPWERIADDNGLKIPRRAGVSSFGFGGTNAHVIIEEKITPATTGTQTLKPFYLVALSAKSKDSLNQIIKDLHSRLTQKNPSFTIENISYTLNTGRSHFNFRCVFIVDSVASLIESLNNLINNQAAKNCLQSTASFNLDTNSPLFKEIYKTTLKNLQETSLTKDEYYEKLLILADLYVKFYPIEWTTLYENQSIKKIASLPTYAFSKQRYWFDLELDEKPVENNTSTDLHSLTINYLKTIFSEKLQLSAVKISEHETYEVYGVDSLLGLEITNQIEKELGSISKTLLYEKNTLETLASYLESKFKTKLENKFNLASSVALKKETKPITTTAKKGSQDIAIIGISGTYPMADTLDEFWLNLENSLNCVSEIPAERWNYKDYPVSVGGKEKYYRYGGFINDIDKFDPLFFNIAPRDAVLMDPQERLFMQTAWETFEEAGYTRERLQKNCNNSVGVFVGVTYNFYPLFIAEEWSRGNRIPLDIQLFSIANRVSYFLNLNGPSFVIDTACSSSMAAIHQACESIINGDCKLALAGGVNLSLHPAKYHLLGSYSFMSDEGKCASFADGGNGYVPSEGVGAVLLKPLEDAIRDNDQIYGVIKASAMNHGGKTSGYTVPNPSAQAELIKTCLAKANINPRTISYIEAHGTGTALGDPIEIRGLQEAFEEYTQDKQFCAIGSVKSNIGHLESAAGISQLTKVVLQLKHKKLVPSIHSEKLNSFIDFDQTPFYVQRETSDWKTETAHPRRAAMSSFGAGGTNVHLIIEEYPEKQAETPLNTAPYLFLLSALNTERLQDYIKKIRSFLIDNKKQKSESELNAFLARVCYTLQIGRETMPAKLAILTDSFSDLLNKLDELVIANSALSAESGTLLIENTQLATANLKNLASRWIDGNKIDWNELYLGKEPKKISLPTYPFAKRRCWIESSAPVSIAPTPIEKTEEKVTLSLVPAVDRNDIMTLLLEKCARLLALEIRELDPEIPFQNYGMDSIIGINFIGELNEVYPDSLSPMDLYRYPTLNKLADYLVETIKPNTQNTADISTLDIERLSEKEVEALLEKELADLDSFLQENIV